MHWNMQLLFLLSFTYACRADFTLSSQPLVYERLDPVMQPGVVSNHTHIIHGGNNFAATYRSDFQARSNCTTVELTDDISSYWYPVLYYYSGSTFTPIPSTLSISYLVRKKSNETLTPTPNGFKSIAGVPFRRKYDPSQPGERAITFSCEDSNNVPRFPKHACPNGLKASIIFPSCWNGRDLMTPDLSHVVYPMSDPVNGYCPMTHPKKLHTLKYDFVFQVQKFAYKTGSWIFSFGDDTGLGFHADIVSHWRGNSMAAVTASCADAKDIDSCPYLLQSGKRDAAAASACRPMSEVLKEDYGLRKPLTKMPGDNPVWSGTGAKPSCRCSIPTPPWVSPRSVLPAGWTQPGDCVVTNSLGTAIYTHSNHTMSGRMCAKICANAGLAVAATSNGRDCRCYRAIHDLQTIDWKQCNLPCPGFLTETCGGKSASTIFTTLWRPDVSGNADQAGKTGNTGGRTGWRRHVMAKV